MQRCCFCFNLRSGSLATAVFLLVVNILQLIVTATLYGVFKNQIYVSSYQDVTGEHVYREGLSLTTLNASFIPTIIICIVNGVFCVLLIFGIQKNNKYLFWPWMIFVGLHIVAGIVLTAVFFILLGGPAGRAVLVAGGFSTAFVNYMFYCVLSYFRQIPATTREQDTVLPYNTMDSIVNSSAMVLTNPVDMQQRYPV